MFLFAQNSNLLNGELGQMIGVDDYFELPNGRLDLLPVKSSVLQYNGVISAGGDIKTAGVDPWQTPPIAIINPPPPENPEILPPVKQPPIEPPAVVPAATIKQAEIRRPEIVYLQSPAETKPAETKPADDNLIFGIEPKWLVIGGAAALALFVFAGSSAKEK